MIRKYLISIEPEDGIRRESFFKRNKLSANEFIVKGIIGKDLSVQEYYELAVLGTKVPLTPAELGCKLSHLACLQDFLASSSDFAAIFEDDVTAKSDFDFGADFSCLGKNFYLHLGDLQFSRSKRLYGAKTNFIFSGLTAWDLNRTFFNSLFGAYAYIVDRTCAEYLVLYLKNPVVADDFPGFSDFNNDLKIYIMDAFNHATKQDNTYNSYIEHEREQRNQIYTSIELTQAIVQWLKKRKWRITQTFLKLFLTRYQKD